MSNVRTVARAVPSAPSASSPPANKVRPMCRKFIPISCKGPTPAGPLDPPVSPVELEPVDGDHAQLPLGGERADHRAVGVPDRRPVALLGLAEIVVSAAGAVVEPV